MQAEKLDASAVQPITSLRQIIGFRNVLVHGYAAVRHPTVWGVIENDISFLKQQVLGLLAQASTP